MEVVIRPEAGLDAEILAGRLAATEAALLKLDERLDEIAGKVDAWQTERSSTLENTSQIAELAAEVAIAEAHAREAEAEAIEAMVEAPPPEPEPEPEAALEVIEAPEVSEEPPSLNPSPKRSSDLEDLGLR